MMRGDGTVGGRGTARRSPGSGLLAPDTAPTKGALMKRFEGKVAVITGGNSDIGLETAKAFAREGASVVITGRDEASLKRAEREIGGSVMALRADVSRLPDIDRAMGGMGQRFKRIDALFVNAGIAKLVPFDQVTEDLFDESVAINFKAAFFTVHTQLPLVDRG